MKTLLELRTELKEINDSMEKLLNTAIEENREMTADEDKAYKESKTKNDSLIAEIQRREQYEKDLEDVRKQQQALNTPERKMYFPNVKKSGGVPNDEEFRDLPDFLGAVIRSYYGGRDKRLNDIYEKREQSVGTGTQGGFMVPERFIPELMTLPGQPPLVRGRATIIPAGDQPAADAVLPALDQRNSKGYNIFGGIVVDWIAEGADKPETSFAIQTVKLGNNEVAAHVVLTDKLLRNWSAAAPLASKLLRGAMVEAEETKFLRGLGVGCPLGVLNSAAIITQVRSSANQVVYADVVNMYSKFYQAMDAPVWVASPTIIPQLTQMVDASSHLVWQPNARDGMPNTLMGIPLTYRYRQPGLGFTGDLMLCDFSAYLIKDGSGPFVAMSDQVHFLKNKTVIKAFWEVDGKPWMTEPIVPSTDNSTAVASPFVVLSSATT